MRTVCRLFFLIIVGSYQVFAGNSLTSGFEFLKTDFSPRTAALGNAFTAVKGDINGVFINPAGLASVENRQYCFNYTNYLLDISGGSAGYVHPTKDYGVLGVSLIYMDYGEFDETDEFAVKTGDNFGANELALALSISNYLDRQFSYGVNLKYVYSKIEDYDASAVALDFSIMYQATFQEDLYFAVSLLNVGQNFEYYAGRKESLPTSLRIGFTKKLAHLPLVLGGSLNDINTEADTITDRLKRFSIGGEFQLSQMLDLRLGYNNDLRSSLETTSETGFDGISGGLGITWQQFRFDYSYSSYGLLGSTHRVGITGAIK